MKPLTDLDEGTIRRIDWLSLIPPTLFFRAFGLTFKWSFIALLACATAGRLLFAANLFGDSSSFLSIDPLNNFSATILAVIKLAFPVRLSVMNEGVAFVTFLLIALWGGALARSTTVQLTSSSRSSFWASWRFILRKFPSVVGLVCVPILIKYVILAIVFCAQHLGTVGIYLAPCAAVLLFVFVLLFFVVLCAFPLALASIATENNDVFDAIARGVSYLTQRYLFFVVYILLAAVLTLVGYVTVSLIAVTTKNFMVSIYLTATDLGRMQNWVCFWTLSAICVPMAYLITSIFVYFTAIYILLRRSLDGTPCDACALNLKGTKSLKLREILRDEKGAPEFDSSADSTDVRPSSEEQNAQ